MGKPNLLFLMAFLTAWIVPAFQVLADQDVPPEQAAAATVGYTVEVAIDAPADVAEMIREASRLIAKKSEGAVSPSALNRRIRADAETFEDILRSEGYYAATITRRVVPGREAFQILFTIAAGQRFVLHAPRITLEGADPALEALLFATLDTAPGIPARAEDIVITERALVEKLATLGYPFAAPQPRDVLVDHATRDVAVHYRLDPGPKVLFGDVSYEGLKSVETAYLEKFITWQPGEVYAQDRVDGFRRRLISTGLFRSVSVRPEKTDGDGEYNTLRVIVEEAPMRTVSIGAGYSTSEGFGAEASWEHRNIFGSQERLRLQATGSEIEQSFSAFFTKPHFKRLDQNLNLRTKFGREDTDAFDKVAIEGYAGLERKLDAKRTATVGVKGEILSIQENGGHDEYFILSLPVTLADVRQIRVDFTVESASPQDTTYAETFMQLRIFPKNL